MQTLKKIYQIMVGRSIRAVVIFRISSWCYRNHLKLFGQLFWSLNVILHAIEISPLAIIGKNFRIAHTVGTVIGAGTVIGNNVIIYQNVTLGSKEDDHGNLTYPRIGDNVKIFPGSVVIGAIEIGENGIVAPNAVVLKNVPPNNKAMGIPAKLYK